MNSTSNDDFDPDDITELGKAFDRIMGQEEHGYELIFFINTNDAQELVHSYDEAVSGDKSALRRCMYEFGKIVGKIQHAIETNETDY